MAYVHTASHALLVKTKMQNRPPFAKPRQHGITLIELLVGIAIGLLVVAVAMGALMVSRGVSGTVSDASAIQQQAAYAMRVIGMQMRQAGSLYLNPTPVVGAVATDPLSAVAFETDATGGTINFSQDNTIKGDAATGAVTTTYRRYQDAVYAAATPQTLARNCLGGPADDGSNSDEAIENIFRLNGTQLECAGNGITQPVVQNVAQFRATYLVQTVGAKGSVIKPLTADKVTAAELATNLAAVSNPWRAVQGVEVCLVLYGSEPIDMPASSNYTDCDGTTVVDMSNKDSLDMNGKKIGADRARRMHMVFRNTFQLRSQGLI